MKNSYYDDSERQKYAYSKGEGGKFDGEFSLLRGHYTSDNLAITEINAKGP